MKKILLIFALILESSCLVLGQDVIILNNKDKIEGKVTEIDLKVVKIRKASNINGPIYSVLKSDIFLVIYENGTQDSFDTKDIENKDPLSDSITIPKKSASLIPNIPPAAPIIMDNPTSSTSLQNNEITTIENKKNSKFSVFKEKPKTDTYKSNPMPPTFTDFEQMLVPTGRYKLSSADQEKLRMNNISIYNQYKSARTMKVVFGTLSAVTTGLFVFSLVSDLSNFDVNNTAATVIYPTTYILAGVGLVTSFMTKGPKKRIKRSYEDHNNEIKRKMNSVSSLKIQPSRNGIKLSYTF